MPAESMNPVHESQGKWWFWDETWANEIGPYNTEEEANQALTHYAQSLDEIPSVCPEYPIEMETGSGE